MRFLPIRWSRRWLAASRADLLGAGSADIAGLAPSVLWSAAHASLLDGLFDDGFIMPGGADEVSRLARPIGLSADHTVLLIGAGTGGPVLSLAKESGAAVAGFEAVEAFADVAAERITKAALGSRASVAVWSASAPVFEQQVFDHALAMMPVGNADPATALAAIAAVIRPGGHLVLMEMIAPQPIDADEAAMKSWLASGRRPVAPHDEATFTGILARLGFTVRMVEDITERHLRLAMVGWRRLLRTLDRRPAPAMAAVLVAEAERWQAGAELMRAGRLRVMVWHAIQDSMPKVNVSSLTLEIMLSVQFRDWQSAMSLWDTLSKVAGHDTETRTLRGFITGGIARDLRDLPEEIRSF